jgi:hypothetical protein
MRIRMILAICLVLSCGLAAGSARAETAVDGRIVRVVYQFASGGSWGFHLAHMKDGRYCVRFGNPGRLRLAIINRVADICFDTIPATVDRSPERRSQAFDVRNKPITVVHYNMGSIAGAGNEIVFDITTCSRVEGVDKEGPCSPSPTRYAVHINGADCSAKVTEPGSRRRITSVTCEHYAAE